MKKIIPILLLTLMPFVAHAQEETGNSDDFDLMAIGDSLADDTKGFYERRVYIGESAAAENLDLKMPLLSEQEIQDWSRQTVGFLMTLGHDDYVQKLEIAKGYFTDNGYQQFIYKLKEANLVEILTQNKYRLLSVSQGMPTNVGEGIDGDRYRWAYKVPVLMSYIGTSEESAYNMIAEIDIVRVPFSRNETGIEIDSWTLNPDMNPAY